MKFAVLILAMLFGVAELFGADAKIIAPPTAPVSQYVLIDGGESVGKLDWSLTDPETAIFVSPDGKQILAWCPKPRKVLLTLKATDAAGESTDWHTIRFGGDPEPTPSPAPSPDKPKPVTPPTPKPLPSPVPSPDTKPSKLPDGRFKVAQPCCDRACEIAADQRRSDAVLVAKHLADLRDRIKSDSSLDVKDIKAMQREVSLAVRGLPTSLKGRWFEWAKWWCHEFYTHWQGSKLTTQAEWVTFIDETILGLKAVQ